MLAFGCSYHAAAEVLSGRLRATNLPGISYSQLHRRIRSWYKLHAAYDRKEC